MPQVRYMIIENEPFAMNELETLVSRLRPDWQLIHTAETVEDSVRLLKEYPQPDLIFMDIELDDGIAFDIFKQIDIDSSIIFTTAYDSFCLKAFKVNSIDYILKPIDTSELLNAILKFEKQGIISGFDTSVLTRRQRRIDRVLVNSGDKYTYIKITDIAWFVSDSKYVFAVCHDGSSVLVKSESLDALEPDLDESDFYRISRKYICSHRAISSVSKFFKGRLRCVLKAGEAEEEGLISATKREQFLQWFGFGVKD